MSIKYTIYVPDKYASDFWNFLTECFDITLIRRQHSIDGEALHIEVKINS